MEIKIELKKKYFFGILVGLLIVAGLLAVNAYGTFNPEIFGHTSSEVDVNGHWLIPYWEGSGGSYKLGFEKSDGSFVYVGWEEDATPQLQFVNSNYTNGEGAGIEVHGDSWFEQSSVRAEEFCLETGECFESFSDILSNLELSCTYAIRNAGEDVQIIDGDKGAVESIGDGSNGEKWGLGCVNDYKKTGCYMADGNGQADDSDVASTEDGQGCLTDDEEYDAGVGLSIVCCKIGF
ncbi:hypothetical protein COU62_00835 [Candidatus Pacearchaeota archaeon CG10_big_fil_rev_8_21_14_0_10_35_219]|nr:hypothetical protein [Candidatus Pacearchaeota archaeon]OIO42763.1 MAG: hypothetical protein AUJ63_01970 [Candidatus Pacearchaeota archaeon CG1_02_35_32]PIO08231.1 MAG: hypothetical protein COU62_00835 [Candidatus Pacearchaeota archaeon CG10_big_fil_rev_8_21_14_0_10_35_219]PIZ80355.1 MAG: hypothetical protein COY00_01365 [Candidatus Pacearchaeota archaeon CG_4_10_14_0_2_um_filter_35_33]PJA69957.1 MAG: hypothetical protein CO155_02615 [Candidatus Pacearchaeota archaeon CG_4_9_14_3_um_filter_3